MTQITLVRHGQANSGARTDAEYDRLSDLGHQQARWLGEHFDQSGERFARVYCGTLRRHRETAAGMAAASHAEVIEDSRLNEVEYFHLTELAEQQLGLPYPETREDFAAHMPQVFAAWEERRLTGGRETYDTFESRIRDVTADIASGSGGALVVTSGGVIGMVVKQVLGLGIEKWAHVCLAGIHTSVHRFLVREAGTALTQFNAVPHLETPERQFAQTHI